MNTTIKSSISLQKSVWKKLKKYRNRSGVINDALEMYFNRAETLEKADNEYWEKVEQSLRGNTGEYVALNPNGEKITEELLEKNLWK